MDKDICTKGKSCKTTCIKKGLTCREYLNPNIKIDLPKTVGLLAGILKQKMGIGVPNS